MAKRNWSAFLTGAVDDAELHEPRGPVSPPAPGTPGAPPSQISDQPLYPPARTRRPVTRVARPVSAAPAAARTDPIVLGPAGQPQTSIALPDHEAPPGAVLVAGVDPDGTEWVLEDDPEAFPLVDPRYDDEDKNWVRYRTSWGGFLRFVALVLFSVWLVFAVRDRIYQWVDDQIEPAGLQGLDAIEFVIPTGASTNNVATSLEGANIIQNATVFRYWLRCEGELTISGFLGCDTEVTFQAGEYELFENMEFEDIVSTFDAGPIPEVFVRFNVPEGLRLNEIVDRLVAVNENFDRTEILNALRSPSLVSEFYAPGSEAPASLALEGTLFPASYDVNEDDLYDEAKFLQRMADAFDERFQSLLGELGRDPAILELGLSDYDVIIIASLIEEEAKVDVDRPRMARAIYNRLAQGVPLQIDATVYYAAGKSFTEPLFQSDLDAESPWNTYTTAGIPPTPIAAPGEAALRAALAPADGEWIFWARTDEGGIVGAHTFSVTLAEHNDAVAVCRELGYCG